MTMEVGNIMVEIIFELLAACGTIFIAGLFIRKLEKCHETTLDMNEEVQTSLKKISESVTLLTREPQIEANLSYLESRIKNLNNCLSIIKSPKDRRTKHAKHKKNFVYD